MNEVAELLQLALTGGRWVALPLAFVGGVVSGLNPCCLPLYPAAAATCCAVRGEQVRPALWNAVSFVVGVALVTAILGVTAALAGGVLVGFGSRVYYFIALVPIAMGLHVLGWIRVPLPRPGKLTARQGAVGALASGMLLSVVLAPCATPILASVLSYAAYRGSVSYGGVLLLAYGLGAGVPIAVTALVAGGAATRLSEGSWQRWVNRIAGAGLIGVGFYLAWTA
jgi:cytochrome c biogenesis protein CcdA